MVRRPPLRIGWAVMDTQSRRIFAVYSNTRFNDAKLHSDALGRVYSRLGLSEDRIKIGVKVV